MSLMPSLPSDFHLGVSEIPGGKLFARLVLLIVFGQLSACEQGSSSANNANSSGEKQAPNVVLIVVDDLGYPDLSVVGTQADVSTPNIDALASSGLRFTNAYASSPQCAPSRAGLMTGRYQQRFNFDTNRDAALPWSETTLAELLQEHDYVTGISGKWHLQGNGLVASNREFAPGMDLDLDDMGGWEKAPKFEFRERFTAPSNLGLPFSHGFEEYFSGYNVRYVASHSLSGEELSSAPEQVIDKRFRVDVQTEWALSFIDRHGAAKRPFFLYLSYFAPHVPLVDVERFSQQFDSDLPLRRQKALTMISAVDEGVGRVVAMLESLQIREETLVVFVSDNGAPLAIHMQDDDGDGAGTVGWNGSVNFPLNGEKGLLLEGGVRVPMIVSAPTHIDAGQIVHTPTITLDIAPTVLDFIDAPMQENFDGQSILQDLVISKNSKSQTTARQIFWRIGQQRAVREGPWKLILYEYPEPKIFLFNLDTDLEEQHNRAPDYPDIVSRLRADIETWEQGLQTAGREFQFLRQIDEWLRHFLKIPDTDNPD